MPGRHATGRRRVAVALAIALIVSVCVGLYALHGIGGTVSRMGMAVLALASLVAIYGLIAPKLAAHRSSPAANNRREVPPPADFVALWPLPEMRPDHGRRAARRARTWPGRRRVTRQ